MVNAKTGLTTNNIIYIYISMKVSVVRVKRKRGSEPSAEVLFLEQKGRRRREEEEEEEENEREEEEEDDETQRARKKRLHEAKLTHNKQKGRDGKSSIVNKYDQELAAQLDAVLGGGSQALPFHRNHPHEMLTNTKRSEGEEEAAERGQTRKNVMRKFVRLTREAVEEKDAQDAEKVKALLESRRDGGEKVGAAIVTATDATASTTAKATTKRTYEEVKVMSDEKSKKNMTREHAIGEEQRKKRNVTASTSEYATDSTKEAFYCYDILCRDEEEEKLEEDGTGVNKDEKADLEEQILLNYMPLVKEYTENKKKKEEEEDADGNWVYDLYVLEEDDVVPKRGGTRVEADDIICEEPIVRVSDFLDNANIEHNLHENEYFSEDDSEDSNAENYYRGDYPEEDTEDEDDDGFFDDGDDSDRDEWDVDDEYDDGYGRHQSDFGSGWGV